MKCIPCNYVNIGIYFKWIPIFAVRLSRYVLQGGSSLSVLSVLIIPYPEHTAQTFCASRESGLGCVSAYVAFQQSCAERKMWKTEKGSRVHFFQWFSELNSQLLWKMSDPRQGLAATLKCSQMIGSQTVKQRRRLWGRDFGDHHLWRGGKKADLEKREKERLVCSAVSSRASGDPTESPEAGVVLQSCPEQLWAGPSNPLVNSMWDVWTRWPSVTEAVHKEGWQLRGLPEPQEMRHSFLKGLSRQHPLQMVRCFGTRKRWKCLWMDS